MNTHRCKLLKQFSKCVYLLEVAGWGQTFLSPIVLTPPVSAKPGLGWSKRLRIPGCSLVDGRSPSTWALICCLTGGVSREENWKWRARAWSQARWCGRQVSMQNEGISYCATTAAHGTFKKYIKDAVCLTWTWPFCLGTRHMVWLKSWQFAKVVFCYNPSSAARPQSIYHGLRSQIEKVKGY